MQSGGHHDVGHVTYLHQQKVHSYIAIIYVQHTYICCKTCIHTGLIYMGYLYGYYLRVNNQLSFTFGFH